MRFFLSILLCVFLIGCSSGVPSFSTAIPGYSKRLIVHSGANVLTQFPWAMPVTPQDITIDFASPQSTDPFSPFLNPTYISDPGGIQNMRMLSQQYVGRFSEIIIEHVGSGLHDTPDNFDDSGNTSSYAFLTCQPSSHICYRNLYDLLKIYYSMLSSGGNLIYKSNRYSFGDETGKDCGRDKILRVSMVSLDKMMEWPSHDYLTSDDILKYLQSYYSNLLTPIGFSPILVTVKTDESYRKYKPAKFPYYYIEIKAQKSTTSSAKQSALQGISQLGASGSLSGLLGGLGTSSPAPSLPR